MCVYEPLLQQGNKQQVLVLGRMGWSVLRSELTLPALSGGDNPGSHCLCEGCPARKSSFVIITNGDGGVKLIQRVAPAIQAGIY